MRAQSPTLSNARKISPPKMGIVSKGNYFRRHNVGKIVLYVCGGEGRWSVDRLGDLAHRASARSGNSAAGARGRRAGLATPPDQLLAGPLYKFKTGGKNVMVFRAARCGTDQNIGGLPRYRQRYYFTFSTGWLRGGRPRRYQVFL